MRYQIYADFSGMSGGMANFTIDLIGSGLDFCTEYWTQRDKSDIANMNKKQGTLLKRGSSGDVNAWVVAPPHCVNASPMA
ncbi:MULTISPECIES: hypothetical protein [unclassified Mesorhizobium]|uniref:hypothetical protein n=1 Tax=unclassified Mesorhizobium TaxID=325217 RepID=UPI000F7599C5|nr:MULTISPECIES: hypothetical protein [unclassified Mesorhizobium]AZO53211.1 hypothetical protein EJ077_06590 [Mesorhizobium sp. M8A.F.Ca.ET.057.01.1.1]RWE44869.1 MAG: hypothetical protein EOS80_19150 [Mesorhizobium sp.]TJX78078.1 MAG: hypothetical protein E5W21_02710 [Mesorhizobium sp.]